MGELSSGLLQQHHFAALLGEITVVIWPISATMSPIIGLLA